MELKNSTNQMVGLFKEDDLLVPYNSGQTFYYDVTNNKENFQQSLPSNYGMTNATGLKQSIATYDSSDNLNFYQVSYLVFTCTKTKINIFK